MIKDRLIEVVLAGKEKNIPILYVDDNAFVSEDTSKISIVKKMLGEIGTESFSFDYLASRAIPVQGKTKEHIEKYFVGKYVSRLTQFDKTNEEIPTL